MAEEKTPSTAAVAIAVTIIAGTIGYFFGQGSSIGLFDSSGHPKGVKKSWPNSYDVNVHIDSSDEELQEAMKNSRPTGEESESESDDEGSRGDLKGFEQSSEEVKLMLVVRTDLGMTKGTRSLRPDYFRSYSVAL